MYQVYLEKIINIMKDFAFPADAQTDICLAYKTAFQNPANEKSLESCVQAYAENCQQGIMDAIQLCARVAEETQAHVYSVNMAVLALLADFAKSHYTQKGFGEKMWRDNFTDFRYKLEECKLVKGKWGTFVPTWYIRFLDMSRFSFGKLQFEKEICGHKYNENGVALDKDGMVVNVHIPRTGQGLTPQDVDDACAQANEFFKKNGLERVLFACHSWLLYPENKKMLKPTSNLYSFISRFDIIEVEEYENYKEVWRLFDKDYTGNVDELPADTSLRRAYIDRMKKGEKTGCAYGVFVYEK